jgi:hypothetical protein
MCGVEETNDELKLPKGWRWTIFGAVCGECPKYGYPEEE